MSDTENLEDTLDKVLNDIVRELAEANRLKRIEIRSMFVIENGQREGTSDKIFYALDNTNDFMKELENKV